MMEAITTQTEVLEAGAELRDQLAMAALTGMCAGYGSTEMSCRSDSIARTAYKVADAMMLARQATRRGGEA